MLGRLTLAVLVLVATGAEAQTENNYLSGLKEVALLLNDNVADKCWPNPKDTKKEVELELVRSRLNIKSPSNSSIVLSAAGFETKYGTGEGTGLCVINFSVNLVYCSLVYLYFNNKTPFKCFTIWEAANMGYVGKSNAQKWLTENFVTYSRKFLYDLEMDRLGKKKK